jgi:hypothetical protein
MRGCQVLQAIDHACEQQPATTRSFAGHTSWKMVLMALSMSSSTRSKGNATRNFPPGWIRESAVQQPTQAHHKTR